MDVDAMQDYIRAANPVPDPDQLDPNELTRFVELAEAEVSPLDVVAAGRVRRHDRRRGIAVVVGTAALALGAVAIAALLVARSGDGDVSTDDSVAPTPTQYTRRLVPNELAGDPPPLATAIGNLEFEQLVIESSAYFDLGDVVWTPHGLVAVGNDRFYWSTDYYTWQGFDTTVPANGVSVVDADVVVHGFGGTVRYRWSGDGWAEAGTLDVNDVEILVVGADGAVAVAGGSVWYSSDGARFSQAEQGPIFDPPAESSEVWCPDIFGPLPEPEVLATDAGFVALSASSLSWSNELPICEPVLWISPDGNRWDLVSESSPFGESAAVYAVAERDGRFVAVGATGGASAVAWVSDDGLAWEQFTFDMQFIDGIAGGDLGWVLTGANASDEQMIFFSADGRNWDGPYERPETLNTGYLPPQLVVGDDVIFGIGGSGSEALLARLQD